MVFSAILLSIDSMIIIGVVDVYQPSFIFMTVIMITILVSFIATLYHKFHTSLSKSTIESS